MKLNKTQLLIIFYGNLILEQVYDDVKMSIILAILTLISFFNYQFSEDKQNL